jgi:hypothetical protein
MDTEAVFEKGIPVSILPNKECSNCGCRTLERRGKLTPAPLFSGTTQPWADENNRFYCGDGSRVFIKGHTHGVSEACLQTCPNHGLT